MLQETILNIFENSWPMIFIFSMIVISMRITDIVKNIDMDSVQKHINTAQKALGLVQELTGKGTSSVGSAKAPVNPRPINKFFED